MLIHKDDDLAEVEISGRRFIGKNLVLSVSLAREFQCEKPWSAISVATYKDFAHIDGKYRISLLQLAFPDMDLPRKGWDPFSCEQAREVFDFTEKYWNISEVFMIHCEAGISRSAAIAAALHKVYIGGDNNKYWKIYRPNALVYSTLLKVAVERNLWDSTADPDTPHSTRETADPAPTHLFTTEEEEWT